MSRVFDVTLEEELRERIRRLEKLLDKIGDKEAREEAWDHMDWIIGFLEEKGYNF